MEVCAKERSSLYAGPEGWNRDKEKCAVQGVGRMKECTVCRNKTSPEKGAFVAGKWYCRKCIAKVKAEMAELFEDEVGLFSRCVAKDQLEKDLIKEQHEGVRTDA